MTIYLDCNAAAPLRPEAKEAVMRVLAMTGNPSSIHGAGRALRREIESARQSVASLVGAKPDEVIFTSGGTEANNSVLQGFAPQSLIVSAGEHPSVMKRATRGNIIPLRARGVIDLEALKSCLDSRSSPPFLISVMMANNETGVLNPMSEIVAYGHTKGGYIHSDAVQAVGKLPINMADIGLDYLSVSAHKLGGPRGVGALIIRGDSPFSPQIQGGGQEKGRRSGTENAAAIAGFGAAAVACQDCLAWQKIKMLRDDFESRLQTHIPDVVIFGHTETRLANTSCFALPGVSSEIQLMHLDLAGIAVSAGSACSSGQIDSSSVLQAMGVDLTLGASAIRVSLSLENTREDMETLLHELIFLWQRVTKTP